MAQAPNTFRHQGGEEFSTGNVAASALLPGYGLDYDANGKIIYANNTRKSCIGACMNTYALADSGVRVHKGGRKTVACTGTVAAGDHLRVSATPGVFETDGTSGSTVQTSDTIYIAREAKDADGLAMAESVRGTA